MIHTRRVLYAVSLAGAALFMGGCSQAPAGTDAILGPIRVSYGSALSYLEGRFYGAESHVNALASPDNSAAGSQVNRLLTKLRGETQNALRESDRSRETARREDLRRQLDPANPTNELQNQQDRANDRAASLSDKIRSRQKEASKQ